MTYLVITQAGLPVCFVVERYTWARYKIDGLELWECPDEEWSLRRLLARK